MHHPDPQAVGDIRIRDLDFLAADFNRAAGRLIQTEQDRHQR